MISFRVSEREFEMLKSRSEAEGARSVSDFARDALCGRAVTETPRAEPAATATLADLKGQISELNEAVRRVAEMIERSAPSRPEIPTRNSGSNDQDT